MFGWLALLFVTVPLIELVLLIQVGKLMGLGATIALVIVTGIVGASLARHEGLRTLAKFRKTLAAGRLPHGELLEGLLILLAGAVLLTPGLLTDVLGFALLVPPVRSGVRRLLAASLARQVRVVGPTGLGNMWPPGGPAGSGAAGPTQHPGVARATREDTASAIDVDFKVAD